jgi:hypothetical protein
MNEPLDEIIAAAASAALPGEGLTVVTTALGVQFPGLLGPASSPRGPGTGVLRYLGANLSIDDYMPFGGSIPVEDERVAVIDRLLQEHDRSTYVHAAAELTATIDKPQFVQDLREAYRGFLGRFPAPTLSRFDELLARGYSFLGRHVLLQTVRELLTRPDVGNPPAKLPPHLALVTVAHAIAGRTRKPTGPDEPTLCGLPEGLALSLVCNSSFHHSGDLYADLDRCLRLWQVYGPQVKARLGGREPTALLKEATGVELEDLLAVGIGLFAHLLQWSPGKPIRLNEDLGSDMSTDVREAVLAQVATDVDDLVQRFTQGAQSEWDLLAIQERPVVRLDNGLLVLDGRLLTERFTTGLFWIVHDHLRDTEGDAERKSWTDAWGYMIEAMAEDDLKPHAPTLLGGAPSVLDERGLSDAFEKVAKSPKGKQRKSADCLIDFGPVIGIFEVVSGRLVVATRVRGDRAAFGRDMEKIVLCKVRQLDATARDALSFPHALFGAGAVPRPIQPVVVAGEDFPISPVVTRYVEDYRKAEGLLKGAMIRPLAVIDLGDLEALEGLAQEGHLICDLLLAWKNSDLSDMPLRNYLLEQYPWRPELYRPARMRPRVEATLESLRDRLQLRQG